MSNELSQKLYYLRKKHNLTLEQVAEVVGVGKSTVRKWETGMIANMRRDKIALIAKALHTTPAYLMGWDEAASDSVQHISVEPAEPISPNRQKLIDLAMSVSEDKVEPLYQALQAILAIQK